MSTIELFTGDDVDIPVEVTENDGVTPLPVAGTSTVTAALRDQNNLLMTPVSLDEGDAGSDWPNGKLRFKMTAAESTVLAPSLKSDYVFVAVQIDDVTTGLTTIKLAPHIEIIKGLIP